MSSESQDRGTLGPLTDSDMDALHVLPLSVIPFQTATLRRARLIKNQRMENVVEVYAERGIGSAQMEVTALPRYFHWKNEGHADYELLQKLSSLPSFDVYTVRRLLRTMGVQSGPRDEMKLTEEKRAQLAGYMQRFTLPLIREVYGESAQDVRRFEDILALLKDPDVKRALGRLKQIAEKLRIAVEEIPRFLEDYADSFLSLAYYHQCLDRVSPLMTRFASTVDSLLMAWRVREDPHLRVEIGRQEKSLSGLIKFLKRMFEEFGAMSRDLWANLSAETFKRLRTCIDDAQVQVAGVLCGLTVKLNAWISRFPIPKNATPGAMIDFIMSEMRPGMTELIAVARGAVT